MKRNQPGLLKGHHSDSTAVLVRRGLTTCLLLTALLPVAARAQTDASSPAQSLLTDRWVLNLGAFLLATDLRANLNGQSSAKPEIDFNRVFGRSQDASRVRADALWRITPTHHLSLSYFNNSIRRSKTLDESIEWGDTKFEAQAKVDFKHRMEVLALSYNYAFLRAPGYELSAGVGVHYTQRVLQLAGDARVTDANGSQSAVSATSRSSSVPTPLPVLGLRGAWAVAPSWYFDAQAQYFAASLGSYDGAWSDARISATWMYTRQFGLGIAYNHFSSNMELSRKSFDGHLRTSYSGAQIFLTAAFE
ncbi:MAG: hypothetical protein IV107_07565 [Paucibacter sp.]|nr:hypothetical protein [Roseateles sp.]